MGERGRDECASWAECVRGEALGLSESEESVDRAVDEPSEQWMFPSTPALSTGTASTTVGIGSCGDH